MLRTAHVSFTVEQLERSIDFYQNTLGMKLVGVMEREGDDISSLVALPNAHLRIAFLELPGGEGIQLELIQYLSPQGRPIDRTSCNPGAAHLCFLVEDMVSAYTELEARGVRFKSSPVAVLQGINRGGKAVYFLDPDGNTMELVQRPRKSG